MMRYFANQKKKTTNSSETNSDNNNQTKKDNPNTLNKTENESFIDTLPL
jgi:hypothetical protein